MRTIFFQYPQKVLQSSSASIHPQSFFSQNPFLKEQVAPTHYTQHASTHATFKEEQEQQAEFPKDIFWACKNGQMELVQSFLKDDPSDANTRTIFDETPLHFAALGSHAEIMQLLLDLDADIFAKTDYNSTIAHFAFASQATLSPYLSTIRLLYQHNALTRMKNLQGKSPLGMAKTRKDFRKIEAYLTESALEDGIDFSEGSSCKASFL